MKEENKIFTLQNLLHGKASSETSVHLTTWEHATRNKLVISGLTRSVDSEEGSTTTHGAQNSLKRDVMETWEKESTTLTVEGAFVALVGSALDITVHVAHKWSINWDWWEIIGVEGWALGIGNTDQASVIIKLEGVSLAEAVNNGQDCEFVALKVKILLDWLIRDLEGERIKTTIRDNLDVIQTTL